MEDLNAVPGIVESFYSRISIKTGCSSHAGLVRKMTTITMGAAPAVA